MLIRANAKINLSLKVIGEREDGYHNLDSEFQSVSLADFLEIEKSDKNEYLGSTVAFDLKDELVYKAHRAIEKKTNKKLPARITLFKNIPVSAGLGGGSADAAGVIIGINELYNLRLPKEQLIDIALAVGSDVPFFIVGGTCQVSGRGENVKPIERKLSKYFVLARPHKRVSTKEVFDKYRENPQPIFKICAEICPDVIRLKKHFLSYKHNELGLSGSGPTMFCGVNSYTSAQKIAFELTDFNGDIYLVQPRKQGIEIL